MLIIATRPFANYLDVVTRKPPAGFLALSQVDWVHQYGLGRLTPDEAREVAVKWCQRARLSPAVAALIESRARGNPMMMKEIAGALEKHGMVTVQMTAKEDAAGPSSLTVASPRHAASPRGTGSPASGGGFGSPTASSAAGGGGKVVPQLTWAPGFNPDDWAMEECSFSRSMVAMRMDRLTVVAQVVLQVASTCGEEFTLSMLKDIFPLAPYTDELLRECRKLVQVGLLTELDAKRIGGIKGPPDPRFR